MCSRYFLDADGNIIAYAFRVPVNDRIQRRFNIAPTQQAPVIRAGRDGALEAAMLRWGLVPFWAQDSRIGAKLINARSETVAEKPAFREAFRRRRCVVPASGYFEWAGEPKYRVPHAITVEGRPLLPFAGLWESWRDAGGATIETYTILTTAANPFVSGMHDRMPAILEDRDVDTWIRGCAEEAGQLIKPYAAEAMREHEVTREFNSSSYEAESLSPQRTQSPQRNPEKAE